ncbi:MAG TPA: addiction module protein [Steroidobacter sp.]|uniref:addiction module protein n=1 Tax=Steroidobacter sp. TaxID=1978227 RepID=UPI002EDA8292
MSHEGTIPKGTDNVLVDLGFEDAEELSLKTRLALQLNTLVDKRGLSRIDVADITGPSQLPRLPPAKQARKLSCMSSLPIQQMSWQEKLRAMEELWESLSKEASRLESPAWHGDALRETEQRYEDGHEAPVDWSIAKQELRERRK